MTHIHTATRRQSGAPAADDADRKRAGGGRILQAAVLYAVFLSGLALAGHSTLIAFRNQYVFPFWDMISVQVTFFDFPWWDFIFFRDNEHLPFVAMPFFAADNLLFAARGTFLIGVILALSAVMAGLLIGEFKRCWGRADPALAAVAGLVVALFFWLLHFENLIWPKQIHMYLSATFALLAGQFAAALETRRRRGGVAEGRAAAGLGLLLVLATFSFGYGAIAWIAVLVLALTGRWPRRALAVLAALFALTVLVYLVRYNYAVTHPSPWRTLGDPLGFLLYVGYYLAHPVVALLDTLAGRDASRVAGLVLTAAGAAVMGRFLLRALFLRRSEATRGDLFVAFLSLFAIGTGVMTGISRLPFGVDQGLASRYAVAQILFWIALGLIGARAARPRVRLRGAAVAAGGTVLMGLLVPSQLAYASITEALLRMHWQSVLALVTGVRDETETLAHIHPYREMIESTRRNLEERRWSVYADPQPGWLGRPAVSLFRIEPASRCVGSVDTVSDLGRLQGQSHAVGWAWDVEAGRGAAWVVVVDGAGLVKGLGRGGWQRPDVPAVLPQVTGTRTGWLGYVDAPAPLAGAQAYAVLADGASLCPIAPPFPPAP